MAAPKKGFNLVREPAVGSATSKKVITKRFVNAYLKNGGNATQAILAAKPMKYDSAKALGFRWVKRPEVQRMIAEALEKEEIDYQYMLSARKRVVEAGLNQLDGIKRDNEPFVSPSDINQHLRGIHEIIRDLGTEGESSPNNHLHLHLENNTPKELLTRRHELGSWFNDLTDQ